MKTDHDIARDLLATIQGGSAAKAIATGAALGTMVVAPWLTGGLSHREKSGFAAAGLGWGGVLGWAAHRITKLR